MRIVSQILRFSLIVYVYAACIYAYIYITKEGYIYIRYTLLIIYKLINKVTKGLFFIKSFMVIRPLQEQEKGGTKNQGPSSFRTQFILETEGFRVFRMLRLQNQGTPYGGEDTRGVFGSRKLISTGGVGRKT